MRHDEATTISRRCHRALSSLHAFIYFAREAQEQFTGIGLEPGMMGYFAGRAAPMGPVGPGVVAATFYNFNPEKIAEHIPQAWRLASPAEITSARYAAVDAALRRLLDADTLASEDLAEAADLARRASEGCTPAGRPLYAGQADLTWPTEPHLVLWHAVTLLREFRGDGHIAALTGAGLDGLGALVTHTATGEGFREAAAKATRGWSDQQWESAVSTLRQDGILNADGTLTAEGTALRERVELATDAADTTPWHHLGSEEAARLVALAKPLSRLLAAAGAFPAEVFAAG